VPYRVIFGLAWRPAAPRGAGLLAPHPAHRSTPSLHSVATVSFFLARRSRQRIRSAARNFSRYSGSSIRSFCVARRFSTISAYRPGSSSCSRAS
jgi:hypothetical protein